MIWAIKLHNGTEGVLSTSETCGVHPSHMMGEFVTIQTHDTNGDFVTRSGRIEAYRCEITKEWNK